MVSRSLEALEKALGEARALGLTEASTPELATAETLKNSIVSEMACRGALVKATSANGHTRPYPLRLPSVTSISAYFSHQV